MANTISLKTLLISRTDIFFQILRFFLQNIFLPASDKEKCPYVAYEWSLTKKPPWFFHFLFLSQAFGCFGRGWSDAKSVLKKVIYDSLTAIATWFVKCECRIGLDRGTASGVCTKKRSTEMAQQKNPQKNLGSFFRNSWTLNNLVNKVKICPHDFSFYLLCVFHELHNLSSKTFWC